jgi:hypothetical protein
MCLDLRLVILECLLLNARRVIIYARLCVLFVFKRETLSILFNHAHIAGDHIVGRLSITNLLTNQIVTSQASN